MPIRFSTEAANADHMNPDVASAAMPKGTQRDGAARGEPRSATARLEEDKAAAGKPGKDINAAGFIKDKDAGKP
ncbi:MAG: hypothetical protein JWQ07_1970 [Ramlibacter sp.]|nr:hypothetical protein [Ramlibacter sp.]